MAEKKTRATREESLNAKIRKNAEAIAAQEAKLAALKKIDEDLKKKLNDLNDVKKKAERAAYFEGESQYLDELWALNQDMYMYLMKNLK